MLEIEFMCSYKVKISIILCLELLLIVLIIGWWCWVVQMEFQKEDVVWLRVGQVGGELRFDREPLLIIIDFFHSIL